MKIIKIIKKFGVIELDLDLDLNLNIDCVNQIIFLIKKSYTTKKKIKLIKKKNIGKINDKKIPLIYYLFLYLKNIKINDTTILLSPNFDDFITFVKWYRINSFYIDFNKLKNEIIKIPKIKENKNIQFLINKIFYPELLRIDLHNLIYFNHYVYLDITNDYENTDIVYYNYNMNNSEVLIYCSVLEQKVEFAYLSIFLEIMKNISLTFQKNIPKIKLIILYSNQKKLIPQEKNIYLCSSDINSGVAMIGTYLFCWRKEEIIKVLIHELIHFFKFDINLILNNNIFDDINIINFEGIDQVNESYTETLSIIILCIYNALVNNYDLNDINLIYKKIILLISYETTYVMFQVAKIIVHFNCNNFEKFTKKKIKQLTSVRSYFIFKLFLLCNIKNFLNFINKSFQISKFKIIEYKKLLQDSYYKFYNNKIFINKLNNMIKHINKHCNKKWIYQNFRMSIFSDLIIHEDIFNLYNL